MRPEQHLTLAGLWKTRVRTRPQEPFIIDALGQMTAAEFDAYIGVVLSALSRAGLKAGDFVVLQVPNGRTAVALHFAIQIAGAVTIPLLPGLTARESRAIVAHCSPAIVVVSTESPLASTGTHIALDDDTVIIDRHEALSPRNRSDMERLRDWDAGWIMYTSGSTGSPKGVVLPRESFGISGFGYNEALGVHAQDSLALTFPMAHTGGSHLVPGVALASGASLALMERFSVSRYWTEISQLQATVSLLFPSQLTLLSEAPAGPDARSRLRLVLTHTYHRAFMTRFPRLKLRAVWGLTEAGAIGTGDVVGENFDETFVGTPLLGGDLRIVDEGLQEVPVGEIGEILYRHPKAQMLEYFRAPEATDAVLQDGWVRTGDLGRLGADGLYFVGRQKNVIKRSGETIFGEEVEAAIEEHPAILECAVAAVPDHIRTEEVGVVVVCRGTPPSIVDLCAWAGELVASWKVPRYWIVSQEPLPRLENSKIDLSRIKDMLANADARCDAIEIAGQRQAKSHAKNAGNGGNR